MAHLIFYCIFFGTDTKYLSQSDPKVKEILCKRRLALSSIPIHFNDVYEYDFQKFNTVLFCRRNKKNLKSSMK